MSLLPTLNLRHPSIIALSLLLVGVLFAPVASAHPQVSGTLHEFGEVVDYPMVFPVQGENHYSDTFWAGRSDGIHHATDIMSPKMTPVVAVADGTIAQVNWSSYATDLRPERCCTLRIDHDDGWQTKYIHLNNDTPGTDDGQGWGIADGLVPGSRVRAGQLIGWVGDSGNAEGTAPHLHFELVDPEGTIVNPYQALRAAETGAPVCAPPELGGVWRLLNGNRVLRSGVGGRDVRQLQQLLLIIGFDPGPVDGTFGSGTADAVAAFQEAHGLEADGAVGSATRAALDEMIPLAKHVAILDPSARTLRPDDVGGLVRDLQFLLRKAGYQPGVVDGVYGPRTTRAVERFQRRHDLNVDGKVGDVTRRALADALGFGPDLGC